jgi:hypothetical protein
MKAVSPPDNFTMKLENKPAARLKMGHVHNR